MSEWPKAETTNSNAMAFYLKWVENPDACPAFMALLRFWQDHPENLTVNTLTMNAMYFHWRAVKDAGGTHREECYGKRWEQ